jgi:heptosyltransferase I
MRIALTGGPADAERNDRLISGLDPLAASWVTNVAGFALKETAAILASAKLVVSVDTGLMHMAAAIGVPLVALHGPTSSKRWGPVSHRAVVVESALEGCGYISLGWEHSPDSPACMSCIAIEAVHCACQRLLHQEHTYSPDGLNVQLCPEGSDG